MTTRRPLVVVAGQVRELPTGDSVVGGVFVVTGVAGTQSVPDTTWTTVGAVTIDPTLLASAPTYALHADLQIVEATASTVTAELRLLDASLTAVGSVASTLDGASAYPEHKASSSLPTGTGNGQIKPTLTTYLVQLRRQGGVAGDRALCHGAYVQITWS